MYGEFNRLIFRKPILTEFHIRAFVYRFLGKHFGQTFWANFCLEMKSGTKSNLSILNSMVMFTFCFRPQVLFFRVFFREKWHGVFFDRIEFYVKSWSLSLAQHRCNSGKRFHFGGYVILKKVLK